MSLQFYNNKIGAMQYNGVTIGEAMMDGQIVFSSGHPLPRSLPDYWYSLEDDAHNYNRGSLDVPLTFESGQFANRGDYAWTWNGKPDIYVEDSWADGFTLAGWFQITGGWGATKYLFSRGGSGRTLYVMIPGSNPEGRVGVRFNPGDNLSGWLYAPEDSVPMTGWFHFALTWEITVSGMNITRIYVDGELVRTMNWASSYAALAFGPEHALSVANSSTSSGLPLDGNIDDIAVWSRTLSASEVGAIYRDGPVPTELLGVPTVQITGTSGYQSRDQFRQACVDFGTTYGAVEVLPFRLDTSQATQLSFMFDGCSSLTSVSDLDTSQVTHMGWMFRGCSSLTSVSDLDTSQVTDVNQMFSGCSSLTDGNVRLIGRQPTVDTFRMILDSGLTREPFYNTNGNPI